MLCLPSMRTHPRGDLWTSHCFSPVPRERRGLPARIRSPDPACPAGWDPGAGGAWKMRPLLQVVAGLLLAAAARGRAMEPGTAAGGEAEPGGGGSGVVLSAYFFHLSWAGTLGLGCGSLPWARRPNALPAGQG